jgi:hypothetical protein
MQNCHEVLFLPIVTASGTVGPDPPRTLRRGSAGQRILPGQVVVTPAGSNPRSRARNPKYMDRTGFCDGL